MAGTTITMSRLKQIIRHRNHGMALQTISKTLGIARNTVKKYLQLIESRGLSHSELLKMEDGELNSLLAEPGHTSDARFLDMKAFFPYMSEELKRTGVNRWNLWGEYKTKHPDGYSYSQFCDHFRQWCSCLKASMHMDHVPGDKLFIDYAGDRFSFVDAVTGELKEVVTYVATPGLQPVHLRGSRSFTEKRGLHIRIRQCAALLWRSPEGPCPRQPQKCRNKSRQVRTSETSMIVKGRKFLW